MAMRMQEMQRQMAQMQANPGMASLQQQMAMFQQF